MTDPGIRNDLERTIEGLRAVDLSRVAALRDRFLEALERGETLFFYGNGGSAALASHFAQDMGKGALPRLDWPKRFRSLSLSDSVPFITAFGNDIEYAAVFVEQLKGLARPGDVSIAISGSGRSPNVLRATEWAEA
ncbi:MAG: SIS domain-containing protein, partial [Planctomycetes bacterium]|nr:SIS domain-containing protein [Planctomycetota bacterium]